MLADARLVLITDDIESRYACDDAYPEAVEFVLRQAAWRFALKTVPMTVGGVALPGFATAYAKPADWLRTHAIFVLTAPGNNERPLDVREQGPTFSANLGAGVFLRYISSTFETPPADGPVDTLGNPILVGWPEHFAQAVAAYLAFLIAARVTGEKAAAARMSQLFSSLLPNAAAHDAVPENPWLEHQLSGAYADSMPVVIARGWWRFALKTVQLSAQADQEATADPSGYPYSFALPADWIKTHALFVNWNGTECPFDLKEHEGQWSTAMPAFLARYLSIEAWDATKWPHTLAKAVLAYLEFDEDEGDRDDMPAPGTRGTPAQAAAAKVEQTIEAALDEASLPPQPWLRFQLNGSFLQYARWLGEQSRWRFAIRTIALASSNDPLPGDDVLQITNPAGPSSTTPAVNPATGLLEVDFPDGNPMDAGSLVAISGAPDDPTAIGNNYGYRFVKPNDWLRTIWFGREINSGIAAIRLDTDYIDEGLVLFANFAPMTLRYLSSEKLLDATQWTAQFRDALLAMLEHVEARGNPKLAGLAAERMKFFKAQLEEAEANDDARDGPRVNNIGRIVHARQRWYGGGGIGPGYGPSQGWWGS